MVKRIVLASVIFMTAHFFVHAQATEVLYRVHMANVGWSGWSVNGELAGTTGQARQIEAMAARVISNVPGGIRYNVHVQGAGWLGWSFDGEVAGTTGQGRRMEAIQVQLTGPLAQRYSVRYRVHMRGIGWSGWQMDGTIAGTTGQARRIEAIEIRLDPR